MNKSLNSNNLLFINWYKIINSRILIINPDSDENHKLETTLKNADFFVRTAKNGKEAKFLIEQEVPDIVLLNSFIEDMEIEECISLLSADEGDLVVPLIIIGYENEEWTAERIIAIGADDVLQRPIDRVELMIKIEINLLLNG